MRWILLSFVMGLLLSLSYGSSASANDGNGIRLRPGQALRLNGQANREFRQFSRGDSVNARFAAANGVGQFRQLSPVARFSQPAFFFQTPFVPSAFVAPRNGGRLIVLSNGQIVLLQ